MRFGGEERVEDAFGLLHRKATARVADGNQNPAVIGPLRADVQLALPFRHRLDAIAHEVHEDLMQLDTIARGRWQSRIEYCANRDRLAVSRVPHENDHLADDLVQVDPFL